MKRISVIGILSLFLISCGGSDGFDAGSSTGTSTESGGTTSTDTGIRIGSGTGDAFVEGSLNVAATTTLAAGGSTSVTATIVTSTGAPYTDVVSVTFTSDCAASGLATLTSPVATSNGSATSTYTAIGCSGPDVITATATVGGDLLAASGSVTVAASSLGSIQFVSATPTTISLKGTGGAGLQETSVVTFKVVNETGGPVPNADVAFALSTDVGGITLTPSSGTTGTDGKISTIVQAGSIAVPVRVIATASLGADPDVFTQSDQLTVTTGIPVAGGISLSLSTFNPEAFNYDGVTVDAIANVMDRFHNPVPDGTVVNFRTEAGRVVGSCTTTNGACTAVWTSQNSELAVAGDLDDVSGLTRAGVSTVLAYTIGEERFDDENGNGRFDDGDSFDNVGEAFLDTDYDGTRDLTEPYIDFDVSGDYQNAATLDQDFNGVLCEHTTDCSSSQTVIVSDTARIVMSTSFADIEFYAIGDVPGTDPPLVAGNLDVQGGASAAITIRVADRNGNVMPADTTISVTAPSGVEINGTSSYTVGNQVNLFGTVFSLGFADADPLVDGAGYIEVKTTTPNGSETVSFYPIVY